MRVNTHIMLTLIFIALVAIIGIRLYRNSKPKTKPTATHTENIKQLMKAAWEEAKEGTKESVETFTEKLTTEYQEAMGWAKSKTKDGKKKAINKVNDFKERMEKAKAKGQNKIAKYFQKAADNLRTEVDKK